MSTRMQLPSDHTIQNRLQAGCLMLFVLLLTARPASSIDAELTNLIVGNSNDQLQIDLMIKGIFTEELKAAVSKGIPIANVLFELKMAILSLKSLEFWIWI